MAISCYSDFLAMPLIVGLKRLDGDLRNCNFIAGRCNIGDPKVKLEIVIRKRKIFSQGPL